MHAANRLLAHIPPDWVKPRTTAEILWTVERMAATPRKYGTMLTAAEVRALAFVHGLHRKDGLVPVEPVRMTKGLETFAAEIDKATLFGIEAKGGLWKGPAVTQDDVNALAEKYPPASTCPTCHNEAETTCPTCDR